MRKIAVEKRAERQGPPAFNGNFTIEDVLFLGELAHFLSQHGSVSNGLLRTDEVRIVGEAIQRFGFRPVKEAFRVFAIDHPDIPRLRTGVLPLRPNNGWFSMTTDGSNEHLSQIFTELIHGVGFLVLKFTNVHGLDLLTLRDWVSAHEAQIQPLMDKILRTKKKFWKSDATNVRRLMAEISSRQYEREIIGYVPDHNEIRVPADLNDNPAFYRSFENFGMRFTTYKYKAYDKAGFLTWLKRFKYDPDY